MKILLFKLLCIYATYVYRSLMLKTCKYLFISIPLIFLSSCGIISQDDFVYLGHPKDLPEYHLYYDNTMELYLLLDVHGCFDKSKDGSGTCLALDEGYVKSFKANVLPEMLKKENMIMKDHVKKEKLIKYLNETKKRSIKRRSNIGLKLKLVKLINVDGKKEYHLVPDKYNININLIIMLDDIGKR